MRLEPNNLDFGMKMFVCGIFSRQISPTAALLGGLVEGFWRLAPCVLALSFTLGTTEVPGFKDGFGFEAFFKGGAGEGRRDLFACSHFETS